VLLQIASDPGSVAPSFLLMQFKLWLFLPSVPAPGRLLLELLRSARAEPGLVQGVFGPLADAAGVDLNLGRAGERRALEPVPAQGPERCYCDVFAIISLLSGFNFLLRLGV